MQPFPIAASSKDFDFKFLDPMPRSELSEILNKFSAAASGELARQQNEFVEKIAKKFTSSEKPLGAIRFEEYPVETRYVDGVMVITKYIRATMSSFVVDSAFLGLKLTLGTVPRPPIDPA